MLIKLLFVSGILLGCTESTALEDYAQELEKKSVAGEYANEFIGDAIYLAPDLYVFHAYDKIESKWEHEEEPEHEDKIQGAEDIIRANSFKGDCEDFSVLIMAFCRLKGIDAVFCLGKNLKNNNSGHIWIEIPICARSDYSEALDKRISKNLSANMSTTTRNDTIWLSLIDYNAKENYELEYVVDNNGVLRKALD